MSPGADTPPGRVIEFGSDLVVETPDALIILASRPMDWPVREFQRVPVFVFGEKYLIRSRSPAQPPHAMRYELIAWPEHLHEESNESVNYTLGYVAERDHEAACGKRNAAVNFLLLPLYPFLGLAWSRLKRGPLLAAGFEPSSITKASVVLLFHLWIVEGVFVGWLRGGLLMLLFSLREQWVDLLFWIVLGVDTVIRANGVMKMGTGCHLGFLEWLWPGRNKTGASWGGES